MATVQTQIRIDAELKHNVSELFNELGMDLSGAVNIFLRQCMIHRGLPFKVKSPKFSSELKTAMKETEELLKDNNAPTYTNMEDLKKALMS